MVNKSAFVGKIILTILKMQDTKIKIRQMFLYQRKVKVSYNRPRWPKGFRVG
jgi:hypothetical protein